MKELQHQRNSKNEFSGFEFPAVDQGAQPPRVERHASGKNGNFDFGDDSGASWNGQCPTVGRGSKQSAFDFGF